MELKNKEYWEAKYQQALIKTKEKKAVYKDILIEVASQHPLMDGLYPNEEFTARLDMGISLYNKYIKEGYNVKIFVPGSRHMFNDVIDKISLSKAGTNYLLSKNIPDKDILGEKEIDKYKGEDGIYNSADECFVASKIYFDNPFARLICICSPYQLTRKALFYIEFNVIAECYSVPTSDMYHSLVGEIFDCIPLVINNDHDWQDKNKETFQISRKFRKPKI